MPLKGFTYTSFIIAFLSFLALSNANKALAQDSEKTITLEDFEDDQVGLHPYNWYDRDLNFKLLDYNEKVKATYLYHVNEEFGNKFLRYEGQKAMHINYPLKTKEGIDISETPILSWDWRVHDIPDGANEDSKEKNDAAASIYVVFDLGRVMFKKVPKSIRYTWSSTLPVGTELSKFYGNQKIIVLGSGTEGLGEWKTFERNIVEDYKRLFGDPPPRVPLAILILSDGDSTGQKAKADYDNIFLKSSASD